MKAAPCASPNILKSKKKEKFACERLSEVIRSSPSFQYSPMARHSRVSAVMLQSGLMYRAMGCCCTFTVENTAWWR